MQKVDVKNVAERRQIRYATIDDMLADVEKLAASPTTRTLGNWPLEQLLMHLAGAMNGSIDGIRAKAPWWIRLVGKFIKGRILKNGTSPGFNLPREVESKFFPSASREDAFDAFRKAVGRIRSESMTSPHPVFGPMTTDEWTKLHLHHAAMHLSFAVP
jgi:hypothetical protein